MTWIVGLALNAVIGAAFLAVGIQLAVQLTRKREWSVNPIAAVFALVALTCGAGHAYRGVLLAGPPLGVSALAVQAARIEFTDWHMWVADSATAAAGLFYLWARFAHRDILQTTRMFEDAQTRRARALSVHDEVVQELTRAKLALDVGREGDALQALDDGLEASKAIVSGLQSGYSDPPSIGVTGEEPP